MTPPATARSTRRSAPGSRAGSGPRPRRISGPSAAARSGAVAAAVAIPAPGIAPPHERKPRPSSVPRKRPARKATHRAGQSAPGIALRAIGAVDGVSSSAFVDRLIRGRLWIGLLAFALIGIVAMQLLVLKLNTGIGHTLARVETLQRENAQLGIEDSMYSAESRVAPLAAAEGMTLAPPGTIHFVAASKADISRAASALSTANQTSTDASVAVGASEIGESTASTPSSDAQTQTSSGSSSQAGSSGEAGDTSESSGSSGAGTNEVTAGSAASAGSGDSSSTESVPSRTPTGASAPATPTSSATGTQAVGPSTTTSSSEAATAQADGPSGGTQAGARE
jgi:hypothetical protein